MTENEPSAADPTESSVPANRPSDFNRSNVTDRNGSIVGSSAEDVEDEPTLAIVATRVLQHIHDRLRDEDVTGAIELVQHFRLVSWYSEQATGTRHLYQQANTLPQWIDRSVACWSHLTTKATKATPDQQCDDLVMLLVMSSYVLVCVPFFGEIARSIRERATIPDNNDAE